jgi:hypothetical protein
VEASDLAGRQLLIRADLPVDCGHLKKRRTDVLVGGACPTKFFSLNGDRLSSGPKTNALSGHALGQAVHSATAR